jgi:hypothetical protein
MNNSHLKGEISKVFLGFSATNNFSLVIVMKDLRNDDFMILNHQRLRDGKKLPELWAAFCNLVKSLLLPMAAVNVIHADIRSSVETTYNILYRFVSEDVSRDEIELQLIDFDSLLLYSSGEDANLSKQDHSIRWKDVNQMQLNVMKMIEAEETIDVENEEIEETKIVKKRNDVEILPCNSEICMQLSNHKKQCTELPVDTGTNTEVPEVEKNDSAVLKEEKYGAPAYRYLFWQVLWIAYTWHPYASKSTSAHNFVLRFLSDHEEFSLYRQWLGADIVKNLKQISYRDITAKILEVSLAHLTKAPWKLNDTLNL